MGQPVSMINRNTRPHLRKKLWRGRNLGKRNITVPRGKENNCLPFNKFRVILSEVEGFIPLVAASEKGNSPEAAYSYTVAGGQL